MRRAGRRAPFHTRQPFLTQVADVFPELLEGGVQALGVGGDLQGVQHEDHAVDLLLQARRLHVAQSLRRVHRLSRTELGVEGEEEERRRARAGCCCGNGSETAAHLVSLGHETLNDGEDVMEGGPRQGSVAQAHGVTQHQSAGLVAPQALDPEEL